MDLLEAIKSRHSVRSYTDKKIEGDVLDKLKETVNKCNIEGDLNFQLCINEAQSFSGIMASYGILKNVKNYIALVGKKDSELHEKCGYYGEKIVLVAQQLGLNTCWVGIGIGKGKSKNIVQINEGEKFLLRIAVGYGDTQGVERKTKPIEDLCIVKGDMPEWFRNGMLAVQLAPTAINQQKFHFKLQENKVIPSAGVGFYTKVDLGIAKYHFEIGAGEEREWEWQS